MLEDVGDPRYPSTFAASFASQLPLSQVNTVPDSGAADSTGDTLPQLKLLFNP